MKELEQLKEKIIPILLEHHVNLYDVLWVQESHGKTLRVAIMKDDGSIDVDTCALVSEDISNFLDEEDLFTFEYYLEVCSPGAERILRTSEEIQHAVGKYVHVDLHEMQQNQHSFEGTLGAASDDNITIQYRDKTRTKELIIECQNIKLIRLAVKL
jgi:Uncharacterized protein conserved in bacteria